MDAAENAPAATAPGPDGPAGTLRQVAALPLRRTEGGWEALLVTSRETRRWIIPKGWPMKGLKDRKAAALEAKQEAGVVGRAGKAPIGSYPYWKRRARHFDLVQVDVYALLVDRQLSRWKEKGQRDIRWFALDEAATLVEEPGLAALVTDLARGDPAAVLDPSRKPAKPSKRTDKSNSQGRAS